jgi:hypothetical protein
MKQGEVKQSEVKQGEVKQGEVKPGELGLSHCLPCCRKNDFQLSVNADATCYF